MEDGTFNAMLGSVNTIPAETLGSDQRWLAVSVRGPSEDDFTALTPRQELSAVSLTSPAAPAAPSNGSSCPHSHWGETWEGDSGMLYIHNTTSGNRVWLPGGFSGIQGSSDSLAGVIGTSTSNIGVYGQSTEATGVYGDSTNGYGVQAESDNSHSLYVPSAGASGIYVEGANAHGLRINSAGNDGIRVNSATWSGVYVASSGADAIRVQTAGQDGLRFFEGMGRDYIRAGSDADLDFRVTNDGTAYADGGWQGAADFAELMTTEDAPDAYEPGDVLVISVASDRSAALASEPYSTLVLGIYSEKPGFIGSPDPMVENHGDEIPVAVVGIVSCKVSAENGSIARGDLLVTSSTPGHAMRADDAPAGTILGKALEPLDESTGTIQVLVTLQ